MQYIIKSIKEICDKSENGGKLSINDFAEIIRLSALAIRVINCIDGEDKNKERKVLVE